MSRHGVFVLDGGSTAVMGDPIKSGVTFVLGNSPLQKALAPATPGVPAVCQSFSDFEKKFGYSEDWDTYPLCEAAYVLFSIFKVRPVIFCNKLNPATNNQSVAQASISLVNHRAELPESAIDDANLVVKASSSGAALVKDTDYKVYYQAGKCYVEALTTGAASSATALYIAYKKVTAPALATTDADALEYCTGSIGLIPDIIVAPGASAAVNAALATKAEGISEMFQARVLVDIDATTVTTPTAAITKKGTDGYVSDREIACWPMVKYGAQVIHLSLYYAGVIAVTDAANGGYPDASPSNKAILADSLCLANGNDIAIKLSEANDLNDAGICTVINMLGQYRTFGNVTCAYPGNEELRYASVSVARFFDYANNYMIRAFWDRLDAPMNRRLVDSIVNDLKAWMNGLTGTHILAGSVDFLDADNPPADLLRGIIRIRVAIAPAPAAQTIEFTLTYSADSVSDIF